MMIEYSRRVLLLAGALLAASCTQFGATAETGQRITPEFFCYATIIPAPKDGTPGGWRAVCIRARVGQRMAHPQGLHIETDAECGLEFGTPLVNRLQGKIPLRMAQRVSAEMANDAAYAVLHRETGVTGLTCRKLIYEANIRMGIAIKGSKVSPCGTTRWKNPVPEVDWPPRGGQ